MQRLMKEGDKDCKSSQEEDYAHPHDARCTLLLSEDWVHDGDFKEIRFFYGTKFMPSPRNAKGDLKWGRVPVDLCGFVKLVLHDGRTFHAPTTQTWTDYGKRRKIVLYVSKGNPLVCKSTMSRSSLCTQGVHGDDCGHSAYRNEEH